MKKLVLFALLAGCEAQTPQECGAEDVDILLDCGPKSDRILDADGREVDFCRIQTNEGRECTFATVHCMPRSYCESRCPDGNFVCE